MIKVMKTSTALEVSFILPVFNAETYLEETLASLKAQTFTNWELIAINDGSTDNSEKILRQFSTDEPRARVISRENRGLIETLNQGIREAKGEWIARIDADDICLKDRLEKQLAWAKAHRADLCGGVIERIGIDAGNSWVFPSSNQGIYTWLLFRSAFAHPTIIIKRSLALQFPYSKDFLHAEDYELWTRLAIANVPMTNIPEKVLLYRVHEQQVSTAKKDKQTDTRLRVTKKYWEQQKLVKDLVFMPCLIDERIKITAADFEKVVPQLKVLLTRLSDSEAKSAVTQHLTWFLYRSLHLSGRKLYKAMKGLPVSPVKKSLITVISVLKAGFVLDYCRNASWVRWFPLKWFF
jgi:glycosyltransferase involved in cell wall biosynthesis